MLDIGKEEASKAKCYFTHTALPQYIDDKQPPTKRKPFSSILAQPYSHSLDVIVPQSGAAKIQEAIKSAVGKLEYAKVKLKLKDVLQGDFFNEYIKTGDILLLSEGRAGLDNTFKLHEGILHIELDKATYERAGLVGQAIQNPAGRKHQKSRFAITFNLRLPSMKAGKPGFERLRWASENVFDYTLTWLFHDVRRSSSQIGNDASTPIAAFQPTVFSIGEPSAHVLEGVKVPTFPTKKHGNDNDDNDQDIDEDDIDVYMVTELLEWISLARLDSPRIRQNDDIDSLLSRYETPTFTSSQNTIIPTDLVRLHWHGFLPSSYVAKLFTAAIKNSGQLWFAVQVSGFEHNMSTTVLKTGDGFSMTWDCE